ncbi:hypothetical protein Z042_14850 [Chania multitudinisentens RB-25]|uniref:Uncharacterized protein n=1 Tax=Chania multitudinisentens RB-25 TaxID=1441930 RepID=W0LLE1_9GAMM|nr:hypothetical protein [Chania multitudinisentens]AHG22835.1 hypothetical protein Z042_14850 [Chania multitudinisentens RB-25]
MKKLLILTLLAIPGISAATSKALDYCATVESWAAQKVIQQLVQTHKDLDPKNATASLLVRTAIKEQEKPVTLGEWGPLYTQTIKIQLPFIDNKKLPMTVIASSIISAEECSLSEPSYIDMGI